MGARLQGLVRNGGHAPSLDAGENVVLFKPTIFIIRATPRRRYRLECYQLQADLILPAVKGDYRRQARSAMRRALNLVGGCYEDSAECIGGRSVWYSGIRKRCDLASPAGVPYARGAVRNLIAE